MITGELKSKIDDLWTQFWTGGITNPFTVIEQVTFLMFARLLDIKERNSEKASRHTGKEFKRIFSESEQELRWESFRHLKGEQMLVIVRDKVFPHFKNAIKNGSTFSEYMKDAQLLITRPSLLVSAVNVINELPLMEGDTKGDLYEYLLSKLQTSGIAGQFRTPRHIIKLMVSLMDPAPTDKICDPACGTGGFLIGVMEYLNEKYSTPELIEEREDGSKFYPGDKLFDYSDEIQKELLTGFDFDATMLRIAAMNLLLHGIDNPQIHNQDTLSGTFKERFPLLAENRYDIILANPPFKGSLDPEDTDASLTGKVKTKKTELLFNALFLRLLKLGGRCAAIIPDGVLFGASKAHVELRKMLIEENQLEAVISLPAGVFRPYAGVSTAIWIFTKGGKTENVWFYDVENDGYSLDDKRIRTPDEDDIPDILEKWKGRNREIDIDKTKKSFFVNLEEIKNQKYDLSISKYKAFAYEEIEYEEPEIILKNLQKVEKEIQENLNQIFELIK